MIQTRIRSQSVLTGASLVCCSILAVRSLFSVFLYIHKKRLSFIPFLSISLVRHPLKLLSRHRFTCDILSVPWTDETDDQEPYHRSVSYWKAFHDALPEKKITIFHLNFMAEHLTSPGRFRLRLSVPLTEWKKKWMLFRSVIRLMFSAMSNNCLPRCSIQSELYLSPSKGLNLVSKLNFWRSMLWLTKPSCCLHFILLFCLQTLVLTAVSVCQFSQLLLLMLDSTNN